VDVEFETVEEFLEHHGTKGMRWGVRKEHSIGSGGRSSGNSTRSSGGKFVSKQHQHKGLSTGQKTALVAGGVLAAVLIARVLRANRKQTISTLRLAQGNKAGLFGAHQVLKKSGGIKITDINKVFT
jgi:hypothetical protein